MEWTKPPAELTTAFGLVRPGGEAETALIAKGHTEGLQSCRSISKMG